LSADVLHERLFDYAGTEQGRCGKREPLVVVADRNETDLAFLYDDTGLLGLPARFEPGVTGAERGVSGERKLRERREDARAVSILGARCEDECRLRQVRPACEALHLVDARPRAVQYDGDGIPRVCDVREDVDLPERPRSR
jgi:hypothetical protein